MTTRSIASVALIVGFVAIAVFGAFAMGQSAGDQNACIAATASGLDCFIPSNLASLASLYLGAFGTFSSAVFATVLLLALFVTAFLIPRHFSLSSSAAALSSIARSSDVSRSDSLRPALAWISIHENSPSRR